MSVLRLGPLLVMVPDLDEANAFYADTLGLRIAGRFANQLVFELPDRSLHVIRCENPAPAAEHGRDGASVITFEVASLRDAVALLKGRGVHFLHQEPALNTDLGWTYTAFIGPGGLVHELVEGGV